MPYYVQEPPKGDWPPLWEIDDRVATRMDIHEPRGVNRFEAQEGETPFDVMRRATPWFEIAGHCPFHPFPLAPGQYYARMARPTEGISTRGAGFWSGPDLRPYYPGQRAADVHSAADARTQLQTLTRLLERICQTVQPVRRNFHVFGNDIRNLLILGCTEVEMHWRAVLEANGISGDRFTTNNYVALRDPLKLESYAVAFPMFPWLAPIRPFDGWGRSQGPSQDLAWYAAYNGVKHNREAQFPKATLRHAFEAVSACAIMMIAQFGQSALHPDFSSFFLLSEEPIWSLTERYYQPLPEQTADGRPQGAWTPVNYPF